MVLVAACGGDDGSSAEPTVASTAAPGTTRADGGGGGSTDPLAPQPLAEPYTVRLGLTYPEESFSQLQLADALGELAKENLELEVSFMPNSEGIVLLQQGRIDIYPFGMTGGLLNAIATGGGLALVTATATFPEDSSTGYWARTELLDAEGTIAPCDLEGLSLSTGAPGTSGLAISTVLFIADYLAECDLAITDMEASSLGLPDSVVGLDTGAVDVAFLTDVFATQPIDGGYAERIVPFTPGVTTAGYAMGEIRHDRPDVTDAIMRALARTTRDHLQGDYHADDDVVDALAEILDQPVERIRATPSLLFDPTLRFVEGPVERLQEIWFGVGDILAYDEPLAFDEVVDPSVLERALGG